MKLWLLDKGAYWLGEIGYWLQKPGDFFHKLSAKLAYKWHEENRRARS